MRESSVAPGGATQPGSQNIVGRRSSMDRVMNTGFFRRFELMRYEDESGVSGVGKIAEGVQFSSGKCVPAWTVSDIPSLNIYDDIEHVTVVHGHDSKTKLRWIDKE